MNDASAFFAHLLDLRDVSSTNHKRILLKDTSEQYPFFPKLLQYTYDQKFLYGCKFVEKEGGQAEGLDLVKDTDKVFEVLDQIVAGKYGQNVSAALSDNLNPDTYNITRLVVMKDLKCGINTTTINKVFPNLIPEALYMRCSLPKEKELAAWDWSAGVFTQVKMDGMFLSATMREDEQVTMMTRSGEIFKPELLPDLYEQLQKLLFAGERLDGELLVKSANGELLNRQTGNGILNSLRQGDKTAISGYKVEYVVWDLVNLKHAPEMPYKQRFERLIHATNTLKVPAPVVSLIDGITVLGLKEAIEYTKEVIKSGQEGTILKHPAGVWKNGTSKHQVKLKVEVELDVKVTGFVEGTKESKTESTFGALLYESADGKVKGSVSGFTDAMRKTIHANRDEWIGAIIAVKANDLTQNKNEDTYALSHPRFVERRTDKLEADDYQRIRDSFDNFMIGGLG